MSSIDTNLEDLIYVATYLGFGWHTPGDIWIGPKTASEGSYYSLRYYPNPCGTLVGRIYNIMQMFPYD